MKRRLLLSLFLISGAPWLFGQGALSLEECIAIGLDRNFSLQVVRNNASISENNYTRGHAGFLPSLDLRSTQSGIVNSTEQNLATGGHNSTRGIHNTTSNIGLSLGWTLFDGFRVQASYERLEALRDMGELNTRMAVENLVSGITAEYFNYVQQQRLLNNLRYAVELSKERMRIDEERFLLGSGSKLQLLQAQVFLNADSSRLGRQYEVVRAARIRLNELMATGDLHQELLVQDTAIVLGPILIYESLRNNTSQQNTALMIADKNRYISASDMKIIASRSYPYVNFSSGYGLTYNTYESGTLNNQRTLGMNYGLTVGINLFDGMNQRRRLTNAAIDMENRRLMYEDVENGVMADLITIYNAYINNLRLLDLEQQNLLVAHETVDIALDRYKLGALSGIELREVQKSLLDAEERLLSIQYQVKLAEVSLLQIAGRITDYL